MAPNRAAPHLPAERSSDKPFFRGNAGWAEWESSKLTEAEIKKDFEWAWKWAKEVK
jgi:hypothetical protein